MNIFKKVAQFTKEFATYLSAGAPNVTPAEYEERLKHCEACPFISKSFSCTECGCDMVVKSKWRTSACPRDRWPKTEKK